MYVCVYVCVLVAIVNIYIYIYIYIYIIYELSIILSDMYSYIQVDMYDCLFCG